VVTVINIRVPRKALNSSPAERLSASQEGLWSVELVIHGHICVCFRHVHINAPLVNIEPLGGFL
jgi:hypothetical protein